MNMYLYLYFLPFLYDHVTEHLNADLSFAFSLLSRTGPQHLATQLLDP